MDQEKIPKKKKDMEKFEIVAAIFAIGIVSAVCYVGILFLIFLTKLVL